MLLKAASMSEPSGISAGPDELLAASDSADVLRPQVALEFGLGFLHLPTTPLASHKCPEPDTVRIVRTVRVGVPPRPTTASIFGLFCTQ